MFHGKALHYLDDQWPRLIRLLFTSEITMSTGMTRAYRRGVIQPLVTFENGKEFHLEVLLKLLSLGFKVHEIPATITWPDYKLEKLSKKKKRKSSTRIFKTIRTHLRFLAIAQPVQYFAIFSLLSIITGFGFVGAAVWNLFISQPAVYFAIIGLVMLLFGILFLGFSVQFYQMRQGLVEMWRNDYPAPHPPSRHEGVEVYPAVEIQRQLKQVKV